MFGILLQRGSRLVGFRDFGLRFQGLGLGAYLYLALHCSLS